MNNQQNIIVFSIIVFLCFFGITSVSTSDQFDVTYAYSLYSGSTAVDFSPDGKYIATGDTDGDVGFWEVGDDDSIEYVRLGDNVQSVAFSSDSRYLAADGDDGDVLVSLLDVATRTTVRSRYVHSDADNINAIAYSPGGRYVAVAVDLPWVFLWDLNSDAMNGWGDTDAFEVYDVAFSPDGRYLAIGNDNGDLILFELNSWWTDDVNEIYLQPGGNVQVVAFSPDGKYLAADGYDGTNTYVNIYRMSDMSIAWRVTTDDVRAIAFSPDSEYIAMGDTDGTIAFYQIGTNITYVAETDASDEVLDLAWSPDGTLISDGKYVWNVTLPSEPDANATENKIYWVDADRGILYRANLDGSEIEQIRTGLGEPYNIALDVSNSKVYWIEYGSGKIRRANLDGSSVEDLRTGLDRPARIRLDVSGGKMYWLETGSDKIRRANLNGSGIEDLVNTGSQIDGDLAIDITNGKLYWTDWHDGNIHRFNLNGSGQETLLTGLDGPVGIVLDVSGGKMYWVEQGSGKIRRANLNGSGIQDLVTSGLNRTFDIALDIAGGKMYWSDLGAGKIQRANLDGRGVEEILTGYPRPLGIALDLSFSTQSQPPLLSEDVNQDGIVDIIDLALVASNFGQTGDITTDVNDDGVVDVIDLALVAAAFGNTPVAPIALGHDSEIALTRENIKTWLQQAQQLNLTDPAFQRGIAVLEQLLTALTPEKTRLLSNYPNPFNPETWIPYQLAEPSEITISIYTAKGQLVRELDLGHQKAGVYQRKNRAAYWDGKNEFGERVASGLYFYTLTAGSFSATGKMLIRK